MNQTNTTLVVVLTLPAKQESIIASWLLHSFIVHRHKVVKVQTWSIRSILYLCYCISVAVTGCPDSRLLTPES